MARICMVAYTRYRTDSRVRREAEALIERGDMVDMICLGEEGQARIQTYRGVRLIHPAVSRYRGSSAKAYLASYVGFFIGAAAWLTWLHLRHRYDVIQVHTMPDFMVFVTLVPKLLGAKVLLDVHDLMPELYQSKFGLARTHWLIRLITWMERRSIDYADRTIAVHRPHLEALARRGNPAGKFTILLNLPDPKLFAYRAEARNGHGPGLQLIYHGTVARRHGLQVAVRAIASLHKQLEGLKLLIVGEGDGVASLKALVEELGLKDVVEVTGNEVPLDELAPIISDADVGIVPILHDDFTRYMLPVKLLEYVALGKPVICSRTSTIEAYFDDSMVQFTAPGDAADLAAKIRTLYENPDRREQLRINADGFNREYNWDRHKQVYYQLIDDLAAKG